LIAGLAVSKDVPKAKRLAGVVILDFSFGFFSQTM
jgi:hypothetical protein